jgi:integrase
MNRQRRRETVSKKRGNGEGSITKRKNGRWMARYTVHTAKGPKRRHIYGGLREGELLGLRWEDVNLERELLQVRRQLTRTRDGLSFTAPKRGKARVVRLTDMAIAALEAHRIAQNEERTRAGSLWQETGLVFTSTIGTPVDVGNLTYRSFRPLLKRTDLPRIRFHDLRHTCATLLLSKGTHPKIVQDARAREHLHDDGHVLPRAARHARESRERHG